MVKPVHFQVKLTRDTNSFFRSGQVLEAKKFDDSDSTYLIGQTHEKGGIWLNDTYFSRWNSQKGKFE